MQRWYVPMTYLWTCVCGWSQRSRGRQVNTQGRGMTSRDLARIAGVSQSTVSRVLTGHPKVNPKTRKRVMAVLAEHNYKPHTVARAMKTGRTDNVGVVMTSLSNPLHSSLLNAVGRQLNAAGLRMMLWNVDLGAEDSASELVQQAPVDGLIFTAATFESRPIQVAMAAGIPAVLVHRGLDDVECDQVIGDNWRGAWRMGRYFASAGHTKIGLISSPPRVSTARDREAGFLAALRHSGLDMPPRYLIRTDSGHDYGVAAANQLLDRDDPPTAIFAITDILALGALDAARANNVAVPGDLWIAGFDNMAMANWTSFRLTTVNQPVEAIATTGVELLKRRLANPTAPPIVERLDCALVIRGTTDDTPAPAAHELDGPDTPIDVGL